VKTADIAPVIARETSLPEHSVAKTIALLDEGNTVPFIARYRKEVTGSLDEDQIRDVQTRALYLRNLIERKETVLKSIREQGKLTDELRKKIEAAGKLQEVEDLYLPYKPKRRTRATIAKEKGLEPLAELILEQKTLSGDPEAIAEDYINSEKGVDTAIGALVGAQDIIAEIISETAEIRQTLRNTLIKNGTLCAKARTDEALQKYDIYKEFKEPVQSVPPHRVLALNRGEKENMLKVWIDIDEEAMTGIIRSRVITDSNSVFNQHLESAVQDSYKRLIFPSIERDVRKELRQKADTHAIDVFAKNLKSLLLIPPIRQKTIMGIDPGFRTGCKVAVIDKTGKYIAGDVIYPHAPQNRWDRAKEILLAAAEKYNVDIIAIGNGTASRETEKLAAEVIAASGRNMYYTIVNEAGASVYSASAVAKEEFPELEASMRGNISIARRLLDPLAELVKITPRSIGVGMYQHDVNQADLEKSLDSVVESCVNMVGVDVNTASSSLLQYTAGINKNVAKNIVEYRDSRGEFSSREQLHEISGLGDHVFLQAAGFLRIPEAENFFDTTAVHPESYQAAEKLLETLNLSIDQIRQNGAVVSETIKTTKQTISDLAPVCQCGEETLIDIIDSLEKPGRDPRDTMDKPVLRSDVLSMDDLYEGMVLKGTVRNVVDFGAFVDIGVKQDGLVHASKLARRFVKNPSDVVSVGDIIDVEVLSIDRERSRIGLKRLES